MKTILYRNKPAINDYNLTLNFVSFLPTDNLMKNSKTIWNVAFKRHFFLASKKVTLRCKSFNVIDLYSHKNLLWPCYSLYSLFCALVISCSTGRKLHGFHHFFGHELNTCKCLENNKVGSFPVYQYLGRAVIESGVTCCLGLHTNLLPCGCVLSTAGKFTCNIKVSSRILTRNCCYKFHPVMTALPWEEEGRCSQKNGMVMWHELFETFRLFHTKICDFPYPILDLS